MRRWILVLCAAPMLVLAVLGAAQYVIARDLDRHRHEQTALATLEALAHQLLYVEAAASQGRGDVQEARQALAGVRTKSRAALAAFGPDWDHDPHIRRVESRFPPAIDAVERELGLLAAGRRDEARRLDVARVDPLLVDLDHEIHAARRLVDADTTQERRATGILAVALPAAGIVVTAALLLLLARVTRRLAVTSGERRFRAMVQGSSDIVAIVGADGRLTTITGPAEQLTGRDADELDGTPVTELLPEGDRAAAAAMLAEVAAGAGTRGADWRIRHADGGVRHVDASVANLVDDPDVSGLVLTLRDIGERKAFEEQLKHRAFHDPLTQLPNRALFLDRVSHALARDRGAHQVAVLFVDLDDFKVVNDRLGHAVGDEVLQGAARRLRGCLRSGDTVARLGGDEFGVLLEAIGGVSEATEIADRMVAAFMERTDAGGEAVAVRASIGIALSTPVDAGAEDVLRRADAAMYLAKQAGKAGYHVYDAESDAAVDGSGTAGDEGVSGPWFRRAEDQRAEIAAILDDPSTIEIVFQPIVDLHSGRIAGYEALSRFPGGRPPNAVFSQAHRCGLGVRLECAAVRRALAGGDRPAGTYVSINLSPSAIVSRDVCDALPSDLAHTVVEITEHEVVTGGRRLADALHELRARGARIAADDAGAGYSGLKALMQLEPDIIKLDRGLVDGVADDPTKRALIESFVRFADRIGAHVCAEGIETTSDLRVLADLDVALGQGYGLARPGAPWPTVAEDAIATLRDARRHALDLSLPSDAGTDVAWLTAVAARLAAAQHTGELGDVLPAIATVLSADALDFSRLRRDLDAVETIDHATWEPTGELYALADYPLTAEVLREQHAATVTVDDPQAEPHERELLEQLGYGTVLLIPIVANARTLGLLEAYAVEPRPWSRRQLTLARLAGLHLGTALDALTQRRGALRS